MSAFVVRCLDRLIPLLGLAEISSPAILISWAGRFESYLIANPEDRFSRDAAQIFVNMWKYLNDLKGVPQSKIAALLRLQEEQ